MNIQKFAPSKKFIIIASSVAGLALAAFLAGHFLFGNKSVFNTNDTGNPQTIVVKDLVETDTDGDGIADWEESLWGTDPQKVDSDGDGIPDGTEITQKKNDIQAGNPATNDENLSETAKFSREFFATVLSLEQSGNLNDQTINQLSDKISKNIAENAKSEVFYTDKNIQTTKTDDAKAKKDYYAKVYTMLQKHQDKKIGFEIEIINSSLNDQTQSNPSLSGLTEISKNYHALAADTLKIPVPASLSQDHLAFANSAENISKALITSQELYTNTVVGITGISQYRKESDIFDALLEKLTSN